MECQAYSDGVSVEAPAESLDLGMHLFRTMCEAQQLPLGGAHGLEADIVVRLSPVEANKRRKGFGGLLLHV